MRTIQFQEAQSGLGAVLDQAKADADAIIIERDGAPVGVLMSHSLYSSLMDTLHLLGSPANIAHLAESIAQARAGKARERTLIDPDSPQQVSPAMS
jgi:antitoxin YefM